MYTQKEKAKKAKIITFVVVIIMDILLLPWLLRLPEFAINNPRDALNLWLDYGILNSIKDMFFDFRILKIFLLLQLMIIAFVISFMWNTDKFRNKNKLKDLGGPDPSGSGQFGTSRWQTNLEKEKHFNSWYTSEELKKGGLLFGMEKSKKGTKIWLDTDDKHTLIIGATRSGKSRKIILPTIWEIAKSNESMILGDPKGELYIASAEYLKKQGYNVITLNLREPNKGNQWNMLEMVNQAVDLGDIPKASELAWDIANTILSQHPDGNGERIWRDGTESTIATLILLSAIESDLKSQRHMTTAYYLLSEYGQSKDDGSIPLSDYINSLPTRHPAKAAFATANIAPYKTRASFFTSTLAELRLFSDPNISDMTSTQDHVLETIGIDKTAVFLITPDEKQTRNVLATLYIDQVYQSLVELANKHGGRIPRRVNFILDEFGNMPPIPNFDKKLTVAGGRGIRFTVALQDIQQLKKLYEKSYHTITGNCHNWIFIKTADIETAKLVSAKTGKYTVATESSGSSIQSRNHSISQNTGLTGRPLLTEDEILRWNSTLSLVIPVGLFPTSFPMPDLSEYPANKDFGFVSTGNLENDIEANREIIEKRWQNQIKRKFQEVSIWEPILHYASEDDFDEPVTTNKGNDSNKLVYDDSCDDFL